MRAVDCTSGKELALELEVAKTLAARFRGLLGRNSLPKGQGLWLTSCNSIHTFGMQFPIDVLFLDRKYQVVGLAHRLPPNRISRIHLKARSVLELPAGTLKKAGTIPGNLVEIREASPPNRDGRTSYHLLLYALLLSAHLALVWALPYFPSQDGPSHLYNLVILQDLLQGGRDWGEYYSLTLKPLPNLGFHLVCYPLLKVLAPLAAERGFLSLYLFLMALSVPWLLRSFERPAFPLSFLVFPVMFNLPLMMGFYSYTLGIPLLLAALTINWRVRHRSLFCRLALVNALGAALFFCHLIPFLCYLLSVPLLPLAEAKRLKDLPSRAAKLATEATLALPLLFLLATYLTRGEKASIGGFAYLLSVSRLTRRTTELLLFSTVTLSPLQLLPAALLLGTLCFLARNRITHLLRSPGAVSPADRYLFGLVLVLLLVHLGAPFRVGDGGYFGHRLPWVIFLLALPLVAPEHSGGPLGAGIVLLSCLFTISSSFFLWQGSSTVQAFLGGVGGRLPKGSQVVLYKVPKNEWGEVDLLLHALSYHCIASKNVEVGNYEARHDYFPVRFSNALPALPSPEEIAYRPERIRWSEFPSIDYVVSLNAAASDRKLLSGFFTSIREQGSLCMWQKKPAAPARGLL